MSFHNIRNEKIHFFNNSFSLIEDIIPLFVYISSCEKYYREKGLGKFDDIHIKTINENFHEVNLCSSHLDDFELHRISPIKSREYNHFSRIGFYYRYINPLMVLFEGTFRYNLTEEEERLFYERQAEEIRLEHEREAEEIRLFYERGVEEGRIS